MTKTDIFSGFLGAGKTTLIRKLISESYKDQKLVLIENEFGEIAIDGGFLKDAGIEITEMNSGCICCTLVGDFRKALEKVIEDYAPDRIIIEPSGVGKLSDVAKAVSEVEGIEIGAKVTVVDAQKAKMYMRNFGEFFDDQVENADVIVLSRTGDASETKLKAALDMLRTLNEHCTIITTPWNMITGNQITDAMNGISLRHGIEELEHEENEHRENGHEEDEHEHHHHEHGEGCTCGCCDHEHGHHHADEIFSSWGFETARKFTEEEISEALDQFEDFEKYGTILRAKGFVDGADGNWIYFDYVPDEKNIRTGNPDVTGRICVIGSKINEEALKELFRVE